MRARFNALKRAKMRFQAVPSVPPLQTTERHYENNPKFTKIIPKFSYKNTWGRKTILVPILWKDPLPDALLAIFYALRDWLYRSD